MPKIRFNDNAYDRTGGQPSVRKGLRADTEENEVYLPRTEREKDDYFDLYRIDGKKNGSRGPAPRPKNRIGKDAGGFQFWYLACLIAALGSFCIFMDSAVVHCEGIPISLNGITILSSASGLPSNVPAQVLYISSIPLLFAGVSISFAVMKERLFDKASLILIALAAFIIVVLFYWSDALMGYGNWSFNYSPGIGVIVEIGCGIALLIVIVCQRILDSRLVANLSSMRRR